MQKFLSWLLVPLLPLAGLLSGVWLLPEQTARWQITLDPVVAKGLGFVNEGRTLLLAEAFVETPAKNISDKAIALIGLDVQTGKKLFHTALPKHLLEGDGISLGSMKLSDDGSTFLFSNRVLTDTPENSFEQISVYDWQHQQVIRQYRSASSNGAINEAILRGTTLAARRNNNLILWHDANDPPTVMPISKEYFNIGLSDDGKMAFVSLGFAAPFQLVLIDAIKDVKLQTIEGVFHVVRYSSDHRSFLAVEYDLKRKLFLARRYQLIGQQFVPDLQSEIVVSPAGNIYQSRPYFTINTNSKYDPWRTKIVAWLGDNFKFMVDRLWPEGQVLQLHDDQTGHQLQRLVLPTRVDGIPFSHPKGQFVAICDRSIISMWDFDPTSHWYPLFGLSVGILLATLLAWKLLARHTARAKTAVCVSPTAV